MGISKKLENESPCVLEFLLKKNATVLRFAKVVRFGANFKGKLRNLFLFEEFFFVLCVFHFKHSQNEVNKEEVAEHSDSHEVNPDELREGCLHHRDDRGEACEGHDPENLDHREEEVVEIGEIIREQEPRADQPGAADVGLPAKGLRAETHRRVQASTLQRAREQEGGAQGEKDQENADDQQEVDHGFEGAEDPGQEIDDFAEFYEFQDVEDSVKCEINGVHLFSDSCEDQGESQKCEVKDIPGISEEADLGIEDSEGGHFKGHFRGQKGEGDAVDGAHLEVVLQRKYEEEKHDENEDDGKQLEVLVGHDSVAHEVEQSNAIPEDNAKSAKKNLKR